LDGGTTKFFPVSERKTDHRASTKLSDFQREFLVTIASDYAIGAMLSQGPVGQD